MTIFNNPLFTDNLSVLDYEIQSSKVEYQLPSGAVRSDTEHKVLFVEKDNNISVLDVVPETWNPHQPGDIFPVLIDTLKELYDTDVTSVTTTDCFRSSYVLFEPPTDSTVFINPELNDVVNFKLGISLNNSYGKSLSAFIFAERLVCLNGMTLLKREAKETLSHRSSKVIESFLKNIMETFVEKISTFQKLFPILAEYKLTEAEVKRILQKRIKSERPIKQILELYHGSQKGYSEATKDTAWGLYNAVTEYYNHNFHQQKDKSSLSYYSNQLNSLVYGQRAYTSNAVLSDLTQRVALHL